MVALPDLWSERCWLSVQLKDDSEWQHFHPIVETVDMDEGDKDIEEFVTVGGGRLVKKVPQPMSTITLEAYPVGIATTTGDDLGFTQQFHGQTYDETSAKSSQTTHTWDKYRAVFLWTDETVTNAVGAIAEANNAVRYTIDEAYFTSNKWSFTDGSKKHTILLKFTAFDKSGSQNETVESCDADEELSAVSDYT